MKVSRGSFLASNTNRISLTFFCSYHGGDSFLQLGLDAREWSKKSKGVEAKRGNEGRLELKL